MAVTEVITYNQTQPARVGLHGGLGWLTGTLTTTGTYATGGFSFDISSRFAKTPDTVAFYNSAGFKLEYDYNATVASGKVKVYMAPATVAAAESTHTHAVALDSGASAAGSSHTHAFGTLADAASGAGASHNHVLTGTELATHQHATESAHTHAVEVKTNAEPPTQAFTKPVIALTYNADPGTNLNALSLYGYEAQGSTGINQIYLESTTNANASVLGETADGVAGAAASCRFWVFDNNTPNGVIIYIAEDTSDRLEFISPTGADGYIIMPFESAAGGIPGAAVKVTVHHDAAADGGKILYFDDNGAADAQLIFVDTGTAGGVIPAADIEVIYPAYSDTGVIGADAASAAGSAHQHAAITAGTPAGTNAAEATHTHAVALDGGATAAEAAHTHAWGTLADAASAAGASHTHAISGEEGALTEYTNGGTLTLATAVHWAAFGRLDA